MDALPENGGAQSHSEALWRTAACDRSDIRADQAAHAGAAFVPSIWHAFGVRGTGTGSRNGRAPEREGRLL